MERSCKDGCSEKGVSRNSNSDVIICCCVETLMVRYYLGVCHPELSFCITTLVVRNTP